MTGNFQRRSSEKAGNGVVAEMQLIAFVQIEHAGERKDPAYRRLMRSQAESKLAAGRMSGDAQALQVELRAVLMESEQCSAYVFEGTRPAPAGIAHAAILNVPRCNADLLQGMAEMPRVSEVIPGAPVAAMNEEDDWVRAVAFGHPDIDELIGVRAVGQAQVGPGRFIGEYVFAGHAEQYKTQPLEQLLMVRPKGSRSLPIPCLPFP